MSGYGTSRDDQYENRLATDIQNFISRYGAHTSADRRTIFLFPGGLGSQLMQADVAYPNSPTSYTLSWIDCGVLTGEALDLAMQPGEIDFECPSSGNLRLIRRFAKGGSGSSGVRV